MPYDERFSLEDPIEFEEDYVMEKRKINFTGFWSDFDKEHNLFSDILREKFEIEISDDPDFLIASPLGNPLEYLKYDCVRILFTGEPLVPDFNVFDYAIGFDYLSFPDETVSNRYYRYPLCYFGYERLKRFAKGMTRDDAEEILKKKKYFCNFLYGHRSAQGERERIFDTVQTYKRVESAGSFMNNMPNGTIVPYSKQKMAFLEQCKFTIACESISYPGFVTEKLVDPICSYSIPIYYGNRLVSREFNTEAIINLHDYGSIEEGVNRVAEVDQNDELYIKMLMQPKLVSEDYLDDLYNGLKEFLLSVFSQSPEKAFRRMRFYIQKEHENFLNEYRRFHSSLEYRVFKKRTNRTSK